MYPHSKMHFNKYLHQVFLALAIGILVFGTGFAFQVYAEETLKQQETFSVCSYNVMNWNREHRRIDDEWVENALKPEKERKAVAAILNRLHPDILGIQEVGGEEEFIQDFKNHLKREGLELPYEVRVQGEDPRIGLLLLSRFPILSHQGFVDEIYELQGRTFRVKRGFLQAQIAINEKMKLNLLLAHLKSQKPESGYQPSQALVRQKESGLLRAHIDDIAHDQPETPLLVMGDMNDTEKSRTLKILTGGRGKKENRLSILPLMDAWGDEWTHCFFSEHTYFKYDYILVNGILSRLWVREKSLVYREKEGDPAFLRHDEASDHRPTMATFKVAPEKK